MNTPHLTKALVVLSLTLTSLVGFSQDHHPKGPKPRPSDFAQLKTDLGLTDAQVIAWQNLENDTKAKKDALKNSMEETDKRTKMKAIHDAQDASLKKILTEAQYTKFIANRPPKRERN